MKKIICTWGLIHIVFILFAQQSEAEAEIRNLEEAERRAVLKKDTGMLRKIWDKDYIVNAASNRIVLSSDDMFARPVLTQTTYSSFTREIEQILIKGDIVFSMGSEVIVAEGNIPKAGQPVKRRYTNIWMKQNGTWKLVARHANVVCE